MPKDSYKGILTPHAGQVSGLIASLVATAASAKDVMDAIAEVTEGPRRLCELYNGAQSSSASSCVPTVRLVSHRNRSISWYCLVAVELEAEADLLL